ncbi:MAG: hypothetical protein NVSMB19_10870 [Vulcanimicrobiaceae bacterium]
MMSVAAPAGAIDPPASAPPARPAAEAAAASQPLDETAETVADSVTTFADRVSRRAQFVLLRQQSIQTDLQLRLDRMRADFNAAQETRSEQLREMNALREMAVEQGKKDDEILKKFIAMI